VTRGDELFHWDLEDAAVIKRFGWQPDMIFDVAYSPDGKSALSCSGSPSPDVPPQEVGLRLWDLSNGKLLQSIPTPVLVNWSCAISPDGQQALSSDSDGLLRLWNLSTGQEVRQLDDYKDWVISLAFAPDGKKALAGSRDGTLIYWDLESGQPIQTMDSGPNSNWSLAISPDSKTALSDSSLGGIIYWDLETGLKIRRLVRNDNPEVTGASGVAYLPDGKTAVSGENDGNLIQWDLETGQEIRRFGRHDDIRTRVEISQNGKMMLTSGMNGRLRLWNLKTGDMIREFGYSEPAVVFDISMSPDGLTALSSSVDQAITEWSLHNPSLDELRDWIATNRYVRELTCDERARYQIEPLCQGE
jgi:WD40 repeat protein